MTAIGPPGSAGPAAFPPGRGNTFYNDWFGEAWARQQKTILPPAGELAVAGTAPILEQNQLLYAPPLNIMLQAIVTLGDEVEEGHLIEAVTLPWLQFLEYIRRDPAAIHQIDWRAWEEIIAAAYRESGYSVVLTKRSGDKGRDVIATKGGFLSVRYFDQVKAYAPDNLVTLDQVHSMIGVLSSAHNVSKGIITTTSDFVPGVYTDREVQQFMPHRLDLRPKDRLIEWLKQISGKQ